MGQMEAVDTEKYLKFTAMQKQTVVHNYSGKVSKKQPLMFGLSLPVHPWLPDHAQRSMQGGPQQCCRPDSNVSCAVAVSGQPMTSLFPEGSIVNTVHTPYYSGATRRHLRAYHRAWCFLHGTIHELPSKAAAAQVRNVNNQVARHSDPRQFS